MTAQSERIKREWRDREKKRREEAHMIAVGIHDGETHFDDAVDAITDLLRRQRTE